MERLILHITRREQWEAAKGTGIYRAGSLDRQGFIHCSTPEQIIPVADFLFRGQRDLVLLCMDEGRLTSPVRYENLEGGERMFPHVYGPVNLDAVTMVLPFPPREDGSFVLPPDLVPGAS